jgi:hypothetical protein
MPNGFSLSFDEKKPGVENLVLTVPLKKFNSPIHMVNLKAVRRII